MPQKVDIATFDRPVTIKSKTRSIDTFGKPNESLNDYHKAMVNMEPVSNTEQYSSERMTVFSMFRVRMHYKSGITNDMVLYTRDTLESFDIRSVLPLQGRMFIELVVEKIVS